MRLGVGEAFVEAARGLDAERVLWAHHVKGMHIRLINIRARGYTAVLEPPDVLQRLGVERLAGLTKVYAGGSPSMFSTRAGAAYGGSVSRSVPRR